MERDSWRWYITQEYPRLREMPQALDVLFDLYQADPEGFKKRTREMEHKEAKKARKEPKEETPKPIEPKIIEGAILKAEEWGDKTGEFTQKVLPDPPSNPDKCPVIGKMEDGWIRISN